MSVTISFGGPEEGGPGSGLVERKQASEETDGFFARKCSTRKAPRREGRTAICVCQAACRTGMLARRGHFVSFLGFHKISIFLFSKSSEEGLLHFMSEDLSPILKYHYFPNLFTPSRKPSFLISERDIEQGILILRGRVGSGG
jgi:hypothetical protein